MEVCKEKSLRWLPNYAPSKVPQTYLHIDEEEIREALAMFRLGNAGLGNRRAFKIDICPACNNGQNSESHLIFQCQAPDIVTIKGKESMQTVMKTFTPDNNLNIDEMLMKFLGGQDDSLYKKGYSLIDILHARGYYLSIILAYFKKTFKFDEINQEDHHTDHNY